MKTKCVVGILVFLSLTVSAQVHEMIIGGREIRLPDPMAKFTVGLANSSGTQHCTASIIAPDLAISAAHCVFDGNDAFLIFGPDADADNAPQIKIVNYEYNHLYDKNASSEKDRGDIVLFHFTAPLPPGYAPAQLLPSLRFLDQIKTVTVAGYGATDYFPGEPAEGVGTLRRVDDVPVKDIHFTKTEFTLDQSHKKGVCHGDSGGPAVAVINGQYYLFGVTSRPYPNVAMDFCTSGSVFTDILAYSDWIATTAQALRKAH
jgi:hypothetical protein